MKEIAADAGVSVQTIYDSVGTKVELVRRLVDVIDTEAGVADIAMTASTETDPAALVGLPAQITRRIIEHCGDIVRAGLEGAGEDRQLAAITEEGGRRHRAGARTVLGGLAALDALDPNLSVDDVTTTLAALSDIRLALVLIDDHGLDLDAAEAWIADTTARAILRRDPPARRRRERDTPRSP